ncbi:hypothetical protein H8356DRAFT_1371833 [Neocallimastix lanati (nom. inval.)]|nr:hypothetical protein H8356DRAFT_1371833 [Neocallimastix sp. JGI-2020a]
MFPTSILLFGFSISSINQLVLKLCLFNDNNNDNNNNKNSNDNNNDNNNRNSNDNNNDNNNNKNSNDNNNDNNNKNSNDNNNKNSNDNNNNIYYDIYLIIIYNNIINNGITISKYNNKNFDIIKSLNNC